MKIKKALTLLASVAVLSAGLVSNPIQANAAVDVYTTPGNHHVNGRDWSTTCEKYSKNVTRCRTNILATQVSEQKGVFVSKKGWVFNNLTYLKSDRAQWNDNPLGNTGSWTDKDKRKWKTECDTATTGGNGCRSYIYTSVIEKNSSGNFAKKNTWVFNNMVNFNPSSGSSAGGATSSVDRMAWPLKSYRLSSQFGPRVHPITKKNSFHTGLDMATSCGSTITAARGGVVDKSGWNNAYGNRVVIKSNNNIMTTYSHMKSVKMRKGQTVKTGDTVGTVGTTGLSTGCHLHFEVVKNNLYVNPWSYLTGQANPTNATKEYPNPSINPFSDNGSVQAQMRSEAPMSVDVTADDADVAFEDGTSLNAGEIEIFDIGTDLPMDEK